MTESGLVVGFLSAAGGSGGTSLAAATACLGAQRTTTVLVDVDPVGPGIERMVGYEGVSVTTWDTLGARALGPRAFRDALPVHEGVHLVGFGASPPRALEAPATESVLDACAQAFGLTVLNLPRSLGEAAEVGLARCELVVLVCPQSLAAVLSGQRLVVAMPASSRVVVVTRPGPRNVHPDDVARALQAPLLLDMPEQRGLEEALACGVDPLHSRGTGLHKAAREVLAHVGLVA